MGGGARKAARALRPWEFQRLPGPRQQRGLQWRCHKARAMQKRLDCHQLQQQRPSAAEKGGGAGKAGLALKSPMFQHLPRFSQQHDSHWRCQPRISMGRTLQNDPPQVWKPDAGAVGGGGGIEHPPCDQPSLRASHAFSCQICCTCIITAASASVEHPQQPRTACGSLGFEPWEAAPERPLQD